MWLDDCLIEVFCVGKLFQHVTYKKEFMVLKKDNGDSWNTHLIWMMWGVEKKVGNNLLRTVNNFLSKEKKILNPIFICH